MEEATKSGLTLQEKENLQRAKDGYPAGFWVRFGASLLDGLLVSLPISIVVSLLLSGLVTEPANPPETVSGFFINFGFYTENPRQGITDLLMLLYWLIVPVVWTGFTVGKRLLSIRVRRLDGNAVSFGTTLLRSVVAGIVYLSPMIVLGLIGALFMFSGTEPMLFPTMLGVGALLTFGLYIISAIMIGARDDCRAIHDFVAKTQVVRTEK